MLRRTTLAGVGLCVALLAVPGCSLLDTTTEPTDPAKRLSGEHVLNLDAVAGEPQSALLWLQIETVQVAGAPAEYQVSGDIGYTASAPPEHLAYPDWYPLPGYVIDSEASEIETDEKPRSQQTSQLPFTIVAHLERGKHGSQPTPAATLCLEGEFNLEQRTATGDMSYGADCDQGGPIGTFGTRANDYNSSRSNRKSSWNPGGGQDGPAPVPATKRATFQGAAVTAQGDARLHQLDNALITTHIGTGKDDRPAVQDDGPFLRPSPDDESAQVGQINVGFAWIAPIPNSRLQFEVVGAVGDGQESTLGSVTLRQPSSSGQGGPSFCAEFPSLGTSRAHVQVLADGEVTGEATLPTGCDLATATLSEDYNSSISNVGVVVAPGSEDGDDGIVIDLAFPGSTQITLDDGTEASGTTLRLIAAEPNASVGGLVGVRMGGYRIGTIPISSISDAPIRTSR